MHTSIPSNNSMQSPADPGRRSFLKKSAIGAGLMVLPSYVVGQSPVQAAPSNRLNIAIVGVGGRAMGHVTSCVAENVVALCDVHMGLINRARNPELAPENRREGRIRYNQNLADFESKGARWFKDYRVMFEEMADQIDAVIISTPDHMHFPIAMSAINLGKHVYVEKPMAHTVEEARLLTEAAARAGVVTQMGNQGHSNEGTRLVKEWLDAGVIGEVREVHSWTDRPNRFWKQGLPRPEYPDGPPLLEDDLDWDLWLGVAAERPYDPMYVPFSWRGFLDFGCGALGDMGCHIMDSAWWGLNLGLPESISAATTEFNGYSFPQQAAVTYKFGARGKLPPVTYGWYSGGLFPPVPNFLKDVSPFRGNIQPNGTLIIGDGAAILTDTYSGNVRILPREKFLELRPSLPEKSLPRVKGDHFTDWTDAIRNGGRACADFEHSGPLTEMVLLGAVAIQAGRDLKLDPTGKHFIHDDDANALLTKTYRDGWIIG